MNRNKKLPVKQIKAVDPKPTPNPKKITKPLTKGSVEVTTSTQMELPPAGEIRRYILTSAQNNTPLHQAFWRNLLALKAYLKATLWVSTFTYDQNAYGQMSVKQGTYKGGDRVLWYDPQLTGYLMDKRVRLGRGLTYCGDANILPTATEPLNGFEVFESRNSVIFPHAKIAMQSVASIQGSGSKLLYATGTVTQRNYIQKKAGQIAEFHHSYGALIVEVDSEGVWRVRQIDAEDATGTFYDLTRKVENGVVTEGHNVEAITWGDIHATAIDPEVLALSAFGEDNMLDVLQPKVQFLHDLIEGASVNHHEALNPRAKFETEQRGLNTVVDEIKATASILRKYLRPGTKTVVVNSNHDRWLDRWLREYEPRTGDPRNLKVFFETGAAQMDAVENGRQFITLEYMLRKYADFTEDVQFLGQDDSYLICDKRIECGMHGDLGTNGVKGASKSFAKIGRRSNIAHTHVTGIWDGVYVAGTSTELRMSYNHGPSSWTHSHIVTYPNGKRTIITMFNGAWRA